MRFGRLLLAATAIAAGALAGVVAPPAAAAGCASMTVAYGGTGVVVLQPSSVHIAYGGCVQFTNSTAVAATVRVAPGYQQTVAPGSTTPAGASYVGRQAGTHAVTATSAPFTAHGSITVAASPSPKPSPSPSRSRAPSHSSSPRPASSPRPTQPASTGPQIAPATKPPKPPKPPKPRLRPHAHHSKPSVSTGVPQEPTVPSPIATPGPPAVVSGPIEPPTDRAVGLPAAVAGLLIVGGVTALFRVLLAEPVDDGRTVGASA